MSRVNRKHVASGLSIVVALVLCVVYIFADVLKTPLLEDAPTVEVELTRTGGLFEGSLATYRGVRVGKVSTIDMEGDGLVATVRLAGGTEIPRGSAVKVRSLSPVGEQYLDFQPRTDKGPYLRTGDRIRASAVDLPQTLGDVAITLNELIEQVDPGQVRTVLTEVSTGLGGAERDLQLLVRDGSRLLRTLDRSWPLVQRLLRNGRDVLRIGADNRANLVAIAESSKVFAAWLRRNDPVLFRLLRKAPGQVEELRRLVRETSETLPQLLDPSVTLADLLAAHDPHIRELLVQFPRGFSALSGALRDGTGNLDVIFQRTETCDYPTSQRDPRATTRRPLQDKGHCPRSATGFQRGAQWAPGPVPIP